MSFDTKKAIKSLLVNDPGPIDPMTEAPDPTKALPALLAKDPADPTQPAILNSRMTDLLSNAKPVYDCVTFRESVGGRLKSDVRTPVEYGQSRDEEWHERFDFEVWSQQPDGGQSRDAIKQRITALLMEQSFTTTGGALVYCQLAGDVIDDYDKSLNAYYSTMGFQLQVLYPAA